MKFFLSSTYEDLKGFRQVAINILEELCCSVEAMEFFDASTRTNKEVCLSRLRESDFLIGIYGRRYGTIDKETNISFTELEYDAAKEAGIPTLGFVLECDELERDQREKIFIKKIYEEGTLCGKISKKKDFIIKLNNSLKECFDGLEGYDYTGIWVDIENAERKMAAHYHDDFPRSDDIDKVLNELSFLVNSKKTVENVSRLNILVAFLKLHRLKDRLLHEPWSEELRGEVLIAKERYIKAINGAELLDVVDENAEPTGEIIERSIAHEKGIRHRTAHVWLLRERNGKIQVLLQKRSSNKDSYPGFYDISSAGHIPAGSDFITSALRELKEELGIEVEGEQLIYCGKRAFEFYNTFHGKEFWDNQISNVYVLYYDADADKFKLQESEIESVMWMDYDLCLKKVEEKDESFINCIELSELKMLDISGNTEK